ncbi:hypothetical protein BMW24_015730 [Mycobacterium heckeshornense]|uniref:Uncharacterized protein n=1 Tax=Mycobacterium heckeshornense TaxID=110505 RepID=A0A2G8B690_9MYCO|nr:hypothetical protein [Mycobacterium heckeshornense]MCV7034940.1 hypothetical protein [Mycobacterium heckeshornense]PIJ33234.1 hypothetical protein BMW24_015730 [Mycobacterium heckeshornense]BCO34970.1 hypothetical protein MHEC_14030 [Mycobacterium heckeshornense]BCQ08138.1 putative zinc metalloprotease Rip3 [Mycobacterium heckeshornense]
MANFIEHYLLGDRHSAYPVAEHDGPISGLVTLEQVCRVVPSQRSTTSVGEIAMPLQQLPTAALNEPLMHCWNAWHPVGAGKLSS